MILLLAALLGLAVGWYLGFKRANPDGSATDALKAKALDLAGDLYCRNR
jgi:hypothetical protein